MSKHIFEVNFSLTDTETKNSLTKLLVSQLQTIYSSELILGVCFSLADTETKNSLTNFLFYQVQKFTFRNTSWKCVSY